MANSKATHRQTTSTPAVPPVDRRTFGHGAFAVQAAKQTAEQLAANADRLAREAADRYIAEQHPHVAELLADTGARGHREHPEQQLTGGQLAGQECARLGCECRNTDLEYANGVIDYQVGDRTLKACTNPLTEAETTFVYDELGGWHWTTPIETELRTLTSDGTADEAVLAARAVRTSWRYDEHRRQVDGDHVTVWVTAGGVETVELTPEQAHQVAQQLRAFADRLDALGDRADEALRNLESRR